MKANTELTKNDRSKILDRVAEVVRKRFYDPQLNGVDWTSLVNQRREAIVNAAPDQFEKALNELLLELKTSHEAWKETLSQAKPGSDQSQIASEAMEIAVKEMEDRLPSVTADQDSLSLDAALAFINNIHTLRD